MNYGKEFQKYAMSDHNVSSSKLNYYEKQIENSMTPYILEEREMRMTQMDIFSRLMVDRLLWVAGPVNDNMSTIVQAQLMYLDSVDNLDITMHIDSPGGSVKSGLSMVDWNLFMGAIPPMNHQQWLEAFEQYKQFPEFQQKNYLFSLPEFKNIFFWEYIHRLLGRFIGLVFIKIGRAHV